MSKMDDAVSKCIQFIGGGQISVMTRQQIKFALENAYRYGYYDGERKSKTNKKLEKILEDIV